MELKLTFKTPNGKKIVRKIEVEKYLLIGLLNKEFYEVICDLYKKDEKLKNSHLAKIEDIDIDK